MTNNTKRRGIGALLAMAVLGVVWGGHMPRAHAENLAGLPNGIQVIAWKFSYQGGGVGSLTVYYSNNTFGSRALSGSWVQNTASWTLPDSATVIAASYKHYPNSTASFFPTGIGLTYSADAAAAMTIQNFNPSAVGGQPLTPSATTVTSATKSWLTTVGWGTQLATWEAAQGSSTGTKTSTSTKTSTTSTKTSTTTKTSTAPAKTSTTTKTSTAPAKTSTPAKSSAPKTVPTTSKVTKMTTKAKTPAPAPVVHPVTPKLAAHHLNRIAVASTPVAGAPPDPAVHRDPTPSRHAAPIWPWAAGGLGGIAVILLRLWRRFRSVANL